MMFNMSMLLFVCNQYIYVYDGCVNILLSLLEGI